MASFEQSIEFPVQQPKLPSTLLGTAIRFISRTGAILAFIALWEAAPRLGFVERAFFPPFSEVLRTAWLLTKNGQLEAHIFASLSRSLTGFGVAILYAVPLG